FVEGPPAHTLEGPVLSEARYPDVLVARAFSHGDDLELVLYPGREARPQRIVISRLRPGGEYAVQGANGQRFTASGAGTAELSVMLDGRTPVGIAPVQG